MSVNVLLLNLLKEISDRVEKFRLFYYELSSLVRQLSMLLDELPKFEKNVDENTRFMIYFFATNVIKILDELRPWTIQELLNRLCELVRRVQTKFYT